MLYLQSRVWDSVSSSWGGGEQERERRGGGGLNTLLRSLTPAYICIYIHYTHGLDLVEQCAVRRLVMPTSAELLFSLEASRY